jgi:hypothetical protein
MTEIVNTILRDYLAGASNDEVPQVTIDTKGFVKTSFNDNHETPEDNCPICGSVIERTESEPVLISFPANKQIKILVCSIYVHKEYIIIMSD